jgi:vitamin B12 transporter
MKRILAITALLAAAAAAPGAAQRADTLPDYELAPLHVSVTRAPLVLTEVSRRVDLITRREIERTPGQDAAALLKRSGTVDVIEYPGLLAGVALRGFRPEFSGINRRTALLIDGRPAGTANLALLDPATIERIEVLRGPASALHGSGAMAGAINVVSRRSRGPLRGEVEGSYGSFATSELRARAGGEVATGVEVDLGVARFDRRQEFRIGSGNLLRRWVGDDHATRLLWDGTERRVAEIGDGVVRENTLHSTLSGSARLGVRLAPRLRAEARGELFRADRAEIPGDLHHGTSGDLIKDIGRRTGEISLSAELPGNDAQIRLYGGEEEGAYHATWTPDPFVSFVEQSTHAGVQLQNVARFAGGTLTSGLDVNRAGSRSEVFAAAEVAAAPYTPHWDVEALGTFAEGRLPLGGGRVSLSVGGRLDRVRLALLETPLRGDVHPASEYFSFLSPSGGVQVELRRGLSLHANAGRAFVAPNAFQLAGLAFPSDWSGTRSVTLGNPALSAERSFTWDGGLALLLPSGMAAELTWFDTRVSDRIAGAFGAFDPDARPVNAQGDEIASLLTYVNASEAEMRGIEWRVAYPLTRAASPFDARIFARGTEMLRARERVASVWVDAGALEGEAAFDPAAVRGALVFGDPATAEIRNVASRNLALGVESEGSRGSFARLAARYVGSRQDLDFSDFSEISEIRYPAFMTLDLTFGARLTPRLRMAVEVENLTDENVYEVRGYSLPGRQLRLRLGTTL